MATFHYMKHGRGFGPVETNEFLGMLRAGVIERQDLVRVHGKTAWIAAKDVLAGLKKGAFDTLPRHTPSLPHPASLAPVARSAPRVLSSRPPGSETVFTTAPPPPEPNTLPTQHVGRAECPGCRHQYAANTRYCGLCGILL